jgi:3-oxoacyl-[acyl-carrier-protein] synthase III
MPEPSQLRGATVVGTGSYIPERALTNADLERLVDTSEDRTTCVLFGDGAGESGPGVPVACGGGSAA